MIDRHDLGVKQRVFLALACVEALTDHAAVIPHDDGTDRHLTARLCFFGKGDRSLHILNIKFFLCHKKSFQKNLFFSVVYGKIKYLHIKEASMAKRKNTRKKKYTKTEVKIILSIVLILVIATLLVTALSFAFPSLRKITFIDKWMTAVESVFAPDEETIVIPEGTVAVYYIDVGQGDATLIVAPNGEKFLIDAGEDEMAADYLKKHNITTLDYVMFTHYDLDHIGGGDEVLALCEVKNVIKPNCTPHNKTGEKLIDNIAAEGSTVIHPEVGHIIEMGDVKLEFLVSSSELPKDNNEKSLCMMLTFGKNKFLFTGDAEDEREAEMIENYGKKLDADVYKAGHHGANNASGAELMELVTPDYAVFSCGVGNSYGHPTAGAIDRIDDYTNMLFRTDTMGTVVILSDGETITYEIEKGTAPTAEYRIVYVSLLIRKHALQGVYAD